MGAEVWGCGVGPGEGIALGSMLGAGDGARVGEKESVGGMVGRGDFVGDGVQFRGRGLGLGVGRGEGPGSSVGGAVRGKGVGTSVGLCACMRATRASARSRMVAWLYPRLPDKTATRTAAARPPGRPCSNAVAACASVTPAWARFCAVQT